MPLPSTSAPSRDEPARFGLRGPLLLAMLISGCVVSSCASVGRPSAESASPGGQLACGNVPGSSSWVRTELYFGLAKPDGSSVAEDDFRRFLDSEVTPRFRNGFSVLDARGQFLSETGALVREPSKLLVLLYPFDERTSATVEEIRKAYRNRFQQESVLRVDGPECVSF